MEKMEKKNPKRVSLNLTSREISMLEEIIQKEGHPSFSGVFHYCLLEYYKRYYYNKYNQSLSTEEKLKRPRLSELRVDRQNKEIKKIQAMNLEQLNEYLLGVGYLDPDKDAPNQEGVKIRNRIQIDDTGRILHILFYEDTIHNTIFYTEQVATLPEIINNLIKTKKI